MDNARQEEIPNIIDRHCGDEFQMKKVMPQAKQSRPGPIPRPSFHVLKGKNRVASFYPNGHSECYDDAFKETHDKIVKDVEEVGEKALKIFEKENPRV
ncbi:MAG: hypothetical protein ACTSUO_05350 [Candidatus Thorarchaeota archaeon]